MFCFSNNIRIVFYHVWLAVFIIFFSFNLTLYLTVRSGQALSVETDASLSARQLPLVLAEMGAQILLDVCAFVTWSAGWGTEELHHQGLQSQNSKRAQVWPAA